MAKKVQGNTKNGIAHKSQSKPRCVALFERGITNSAEFLTATTSAIADVASGRMGPTSGNSIFAGQRNILKMLELQQKFGSPAAGKDGAKVLAIGN